VKELFPDAQVTIGPVIEDGFYYDFSYKRAFHARRTSPRSRRRWPSSPARTRRSVRSQMPRDDAGQVLRRDGRALQGGDHRRRYPSNEPISLYAKASSSTSVRGPHVPSTGKLKVFKLMKVAGAYWRGDSKNEMLQRIYGTAWAKKEDQDAYLHRIEEAEKRDHRRLGRQLDLFHMQEEAPGMVFWHPNGWTIWQQVEQYMRRVYQANGYQEVRCPQILDRALWERSGHWQNFGENMFTTESEKRDFAVKPMNCPGHVQIFNSDLRSYRDLPLRYGEFGACHRNEPSGALHGIMRVRGFTQDDGHIFCTADQIQAGSHRRSTSRRRTSIATSASPTVTIKLALRPDKRLGDDATWDRAENALRDALSPCGAKLDRAARRRRVLRPKIEYHLKDSIGRSWQCGTMQVDFQMPARLWRGVRRRGRHPAGAGDAASRDRRLARAASSGILIEESRRRAARCGWRRSSSWCLRSPTASRPMRSAWPGALQAAGFRATADLRNEKITYKIREHSLQKLPYQIIVGDKELEADTVAVRTRGGEDLGSMPLDTLLARLRDEVRTADKALSIQAFSVSWGFAIRPFFVLLGESQ
jgi:threonyl-tRNA synthetase